VLLTDGTKCVEMVALTNDQQTSNTETKVLIKVRMTKPVASSSSLGTRAVLHAQYRIITDCLLFLSLATITGLLVQHRFN
jgi:hypothetical protein